MRLLLMKLLRIAEITMVSDLVSEDYVPAPTPELISAANEMLKHNRIIVHNTMGKSCVRVRQVDAKPQGTAVQTEVEGNEEAEFKVVFDVTTSPVCLPADEEAE
uniref:Uncharacterized protein n=1 Tax=Globisporangium ultimum (strain ATCC 200006 / CBS 805.95 / DAOM BR144) TaxID=431595 RepID=K3X8J7_GLOUD